MLKDNSLIGMLKGDWEMKSLRITAMIVLLFFSGGLIGCGGGGAKVTTTTTTVTLGQQLIDLDAAYKKGALDEKQYNKAKKELLDKYK
jgi:hypothetical protein